VRKGADDGLGLEAVGACLLPGFTTEDEQAE
jgi:hypothetical protein